MNSIYIKKKAHLSQSKVLERLQSLGRLLVLPRSRLGIWEPSSLRHLHTKSLSSFVGDKTITSFNPWQQEIEGAVVLSVTKSKHAFTKNWVCSQVRGFGGPMAETVTTNTATKHKNGTNTLFILVTMVYLNHSLLLLILDGWNIVRFLNL